MLESRAVASGRRWIARAERSVIVAAVDDRDVPGGRGPHEKAAEPSVEVLAERVEALARRIAADGVDPAAAEALASEARTLADELSASVEALARGRSDRQQSLL